MKCNPLRWMWGLLPLVLIAWIGQLGTISRVEEDLTGRTRAHLDQNGLQWANVAFKGRDALITGRAEEESDQRRPGIEAAKVWGVRAIEDRIEVLQLIKNYVWSATVRGNELALTGYVPNEAARKAILASARSSLPKLQVRDSLELARGAPDQKVWLGGTAFALRQLAALKNGGTATIEGAALTVDGEADTSRSYEGVRTALSGNMPAGISLKSDKVIPPAVKPYTWGAVLKGRQVELTGHAPSVAARNEIKAAAERALPGGSVVDRMSLASGAPADWLRVMTGAVDRLGQLKQGTAEATDQQLTVTGLTETEAAANQVRGALRAGVPGSYRLTDRIEQDPAVKAAEEARRRAAEDASQREVEQQRLAATQREDQERQARLRAEEEARRQKAAAEAAAMTAAARQKTDADAAAARRAAEETKRLADEVARKAAAEAEARRRAEEQARAQTDAAAKARAAEAQRCQTEVTSAADTGTILFQRASAEIDRRSHETLDKLARIVKGCPGFTIEVGGHTDNEGEPGRNQRLSDRRANSVMEYLVRHGAPTGALTAIGYGEVKPKVVNDSPENMARNRRIEFSVKAR